jgi:hypothetical protein
VPFQLGHPMGTPGDAAFQKRVLRALLDLFNRPEGPIIEDFNEDEEESDEIVMLSCPVIYSNIETESENKDPLYSALTREIRSMRSWYEASLAKRHRTTVGVSRLALDDLGDFIYSFLKDESPENPRDDVLLPNILKMAVEDLKSYYIEGLTAQPGQEKVSGKKLAEWFWEETVAGKVIWNVKTVCEKSNDRMMAMTAGHMLIPGDIARKKQAG